MFPELNEAPLTIQVKEMAKILGISQNKAYELTRIEGFPTIRVGRKILIPKPGLLKWLEKPQVVLF